MTTAAPVLTEYEEARRLYGHDTVAYAEDCLKIVNKERQLVPLVANGPQLKYAAVIRELREANKPVRILITKSRQWGGSTWTAAEIEQGVTQNSHRDALIVAHDDMTSGKLFDMYDRFWRNLPDEYDLKPRKGHSRKSAYAHYPDLDSSILVTTARSFEAGRGQTYSYVHGSEVAHYPDIDRKLMGVLETVPELPGTIVVLESTANGYNAFKDMWDDAVGGKSDYVPIFVGWHEDATLTRPFISESEREEFIDSIGAGEFGEAEPMLVERFGCTPEQLNWRRHKIANPPFRGDLRRFNQEFPATPEDAFLSTGKNVFSTFLVTKVIEQAVPPKNVGQIQAGRKIKRKVLSGIVDVPAEPKWVPPKGLMQGREHWSVWEHPQDPAARYVVALDPAGEENEGTDTAYHAIEVINHRTLQQAAEWRARRDPDEVAEMVMLAALYWNEAWLAVETTGGYGGSIVRKVRRDFHYPFVYKRKPLTTAKEREEDRLGWHTDAQTKPIIIDRGKELLRTGVHGIRSASLAREMLTYIRTERGKTKPEKGKFADLLMAWLIAQQVAQEKPPRPDRQRGRTTSTATRTTRFERTGY